MSKKKKIIIISICAVVVLAIVAIVLFFVLNSGTSKMTDTGIYADKVSDVMYTNISSVEKYTGVVEAAETLDIKVDSEKTVKEVLVKEGDAVEVGTPLFTYDVDELSTKRQTAALELESLNNQLSGYATQINELTEEKKSAASDQQLDYTLQIQQVQTQQKQCQYDIAAKTNEISKLDSSIENATDTSTMSGMVKKINNTASDEASEVFMTIITTGQYRVKGTINEQSLYNSGLEEGMSVIVRSRVDESATWLGTISKIDTESPQSDTNMDDMYMEGDNGEKASKYYFYVELASTEDLLLGQHIFIEPDYGQSTVKEGIWIDESYIVNDGDNAYVWALDDDKKLEKKEVKLGEYDENLMMYEIKSGLTEDDYIVWNSDDLKEGQSAMTWEDFAEQMEDMEGMEGMDDLEDMEYFDEMENFDEDIEIDDSGVEVYEDKTMEVE